MRVTGLINSLCSGGAQRQMALLAKNLKQRGLDVALLTYRPDPFFKPLIDAAGITHEEVATSTKLGRLLQLYRRLRGREGQIVISFLTAPSVYAELATLPYRRFGLIASERSGFAGDIPWRDRLRLSLHHRADLLVANSSAMHDKLALTLPALARKTEVIRNCVDLTHFQPLPAPPGRALRLLVLARYSAEKNPLGVLAAFREAQARLDRPLSLDWYGDTYEALGSSHPLAQPYLSLRHAVAEAGLGESFRLHRPLEDPRQAMAACHAMLLGSFYEGCSNVVCEGLACARPQLVTDVGDNAALVEAGKSGLLFPAGSDAAMTQAIVAFAQLDEPSQRRMGLEGRAQAERMLSETSFTDRWLDLIQQTAQLRGLG